MNKDRIGSVFSFEHNKAFYFVFLSMFFVIITATILAFRTSSICDTTNLITSFDKSKFLIAQMILLLLIFFSVFSGLLSILAYIFLFLYSFYNAFAILVYSNGNVIINTIILSTLYALLSIFLSALCSFWIIKSFKTSIIHIYRSFTKSKISFIFNLILNVICFCAAVLFVITVYYKM